jgi:hypothetical protein
MARNLSGGGGNAYGLHHTRSWRRVNVSKEVLSQIFHQNNEVLPYDESTGMAPIRRW